MILFQNCSHVLIFLLFVDGLHALWTGYDFRLNCVGSKISIRNLNNCACSVLPNVQFLYPTKAEWHDRHQHLRRRRSRLNASETEGFRDDVSKSAESFSSFQNQDGYELDPSKAGFSTKLGSSYGDDVSEEKYAEQKKSSPSSLSNLMRKQQVSWMSKLSTVLSFHTILTASTTARAVPPDSLSQDTSIVIPRKERLYDTNRRSYLPSHPERFVLKSMKDRNVLVMGEVHSNSFDHLLEFRLLSTLTGFYGPKQMAVGLECFYRQHQRALDNFIFDHGNMGILKEQTNWKETWGYDLSQYAKIFNYAFKNKIRLIGLNVPIQVVEYVASFGLEEIPQNLKELLPAIDLSNQMHKERFISAISESSGHGDAVSNESTVFMNRLYEAQTLWDEYMAESASNFVKGNPNTKLMVIAGSGHVTGRGGIPDRIAKRVGGRPPFVVVPYEVPWSDDGLPVIEIPPNTNECDWAWYHPSPDIV